MVMVKALAMVKVTECVEVRLKRSAYLSPGCLVKDMEIKFLEEIYLFLSIKESRLINFFLRASLKDWASSKELQKQTSAG